MTRRFPVDIALETKLVYCHHSLYVVARVMGNTRHRPSRVKIHNCV